ncbi:MAG: DUF1830 domain-containing protein [Pleurocapsa sp.]
MSSNWQETIAKPISKMLCYYTNTTHKMQIIGVTNSNNLNFTKIIFPRQRILFETTPEGQLEIYTSSVGEQKIAQIIPCQNLQVDVETMLIAEHKSA